MGVRRTTKFKETLYRVLIPVLGYLVTARMAFGDDGEDDTDDYDGLPGRTEEQIETLFLNFDEVVETIALYSAIGATLTILLCLSVFLKLRRWMAYVALTIASMIWLAFFEQNTTGLLWIGLNMDYWALVVLGFGLASLHLLIAAFSILPQVRLGWMRYVLIAAAGLIWIALVMDRPETPSAIPLIYWIIGGVACLGHATAIPSFLTLQRSPGGMSRNGFIFAVTLASAGLVALLFGELGEETDVIFLVRIALLAVTVFFLIFFVRHVLSLLFERDESARRALESARSEAEKSQALFETEKRYSRARDAARLHTERLAQASHDIRQPIASLRATMDVVAKDQPANTRKQLNAAFDYLDMLAKSYLNTGDPNSSQDGQIAPGNDGLESVETSIIVSTLDRMFRKEAEGKSLIFDAVTENVSIRVQPLVLTRILSNLLANAIQHTREGGIKLKGTAEADAFRFSVSNSADLPEGLDGNALFDPFVKGTQSGGSGLGLSIVESLTKRHGWRLLYENKPGEGTQFEVIVPIR